MNWTSKFKAGGEAQMLKEGNIKYSHGEVKEVGEETILIHWQEDEEPTEYNMEHFNQITEW